MANGNWDFYIKQTTLMQAIEAYQELANTLGREKIEIIQASDKVLRDWQGNAAHSTCYNIRNMLAKGIYYRSCREIGIMRRCLEESLPWIGGILKQSEEFTDQLENDDYVELHMSADDYDHVPIRNGGVLCINYSEVEIIAQCCDKVAELTDKVTQALTSVVDDCGYLLGDVDETLEGMQSAARKLHRIENYKKALMIFAKTTGYVEDFIQEQMYAITGEEDYTGGDVGSDNAQSDQYEEFQGEQLVTMNQMTEFGFNITDEELEKLNRLLEENGVTDIGSIALFLATCAHESDYGRKLLEEGTEDYFIQNGYTLKTRGAGYIQITGKDQSLFYTKYLSIEVPDNPAQDIADNYAWESAVWEWSRQTKGKNVIMNEYVEKNGHGEGIFLITQYFINGYLSSSIYPDFDSDLASIRKEEANYQYNWQENLLRVNGREYPLPNNYADRLEKYGRAMDGFIGENDDVIKE